MYFVLSCPVNEHGHGHDFRNSGHKVVYLVLVELLTERHWLYIFPTEMSQP